MRNDGRDWNQLRPVVLQKDVSLHAEGSVMVEFGQTRVLCTASWDEAVPRWLQGKGRGWVTAEYGMLPRSTNTRIRRDKAANGGRTQEISRLIGRSLRAAVDLEALGEHQVVVDCDVIQADGGTRTAAITGGFVALALAFQKLMAEDKIKKNPITRYVSAISVGLQDERTLLDLCYEEDSQIETDMNFVMTDAGDFIEIQGTAEGAPFSKAQLDQMIELASKGCSELIEKQKEVVGEL